MIDLWVLVADGILIILYSWTGIYIYNKIKSQWRIATETSSSKVDDFTEMDSNNEAVQRNLNKIKKILTALPLFPVVYVTQWSLYLSWKLFLAQTWSQTMATVTITNMGGMFNVIVFYRLLMNPVNREKQKKKEKEEKKMQQLELQQKQRAIST